MCQLRDLGDKETTRKARFFIKGKSRRELSKHEWKKQGSAKPCSSPNIDPLRKESKKESKQLKRLDKII